MNYIPNPSHIYIYTHTPISRVLKLRNPIFQIKHSNFINFFLKIQLLLMVEYVDISFLGEREKL